MRCSKCATENPAGNKFCGGCGSALSAKCSQCGTENISSFKFCGNCGASLSVQGSPNAEASVTASSSIRVAAKPSEVPEGERKTVTALFADIKGSMELIEDLDPEEARAIVDPALKLMMDAVHRDGGYVAQHAQRTLYAALAMHGELRRHADHMRRRIVQCA
jgi:adenylate cyclase